MKQVNTHQYSTTQFERDLTEGVNGDSPGGIHVNTVFLVSQVSTAAINYAIQFSNHFILKVLSSTSKSRLSSLCTRKPDNLSPTSLHRKFPCHDQSLLALT